MISTLNFHPDTDPKLLCTCGHPECDKRSVSQLVLEWAQIIREDAGRPLTITSGGRCPNHPSEIHRTTPADHQNCVAVDIAVKGGIERGEIVRMGIMRGFNAIGVAKTFVHLGYRSGAPLVMWVYA